MTRFLTSPMRLPKQMMTLTFLDEDTGMAAAGGGSTVLLLLMIEAAIGLRKLDVTEQPANQIL